MYMRSLLKIFTVATLCLSLTVNQAGARGRNNAQGSPQQSQSERRQPSNNGKHHGGGQHQGNHGQRPGGGNHGNPGKNPGGNIHGNPSGHGGSHQHNPGPHPGGSNHGNPSGHGVHPVQPPHYHNPGPGPRPGAGHYGHLPQRPPHRPLMPARPMPFRPPVPPPGFRPAPGAHLFGSILGVTIGSAIGVTLDYLLGHGYNVTGYTTDAVYINNVSQLNLLWPNATLYYGTGGVLRGSEFVYSTPYFDQARYNMAYGYLTGAYGAPVSTMPLQGGGVRVNWFGYNGQYVSLQFQPATAYDGSYRYYTTLSYGI